MPYSAKGKKIGSYKGGGKVKPYKKGGKIGNKSYIKSRKKKKK